MHEWFASWFGKADQETVQDGEDFRQVPISDVAAVRAILINAAKELCGTSYAEVLDALGHRRLAL